MVVAVFPVERVAQLREGGRNLLEATGEAAVDDRERTVDIAGIPADPIRAEPIDAVRDLFERGHQGRV